MKNYVLCMVLALSACKETAVVTPAPVPLPGPTSTLETLTNIATSSSCGTRVWRDRGKAPIGYVKGMALMFAKSYCKLQAKDSATLLMAKAATGDASTDALSFFAADFQNMKVSNAVACADVLQHLYLLAFGQGMMESSGQYCEGYDVSAGVQTASEAEGGLFQTSYNASGSSSELPKMLTKYHIGDAQCLEKTFLEGVTYKGKPGCAPRAIKGSGAGADFQALAKSCPSFATEFALVTFRTLRKHYGPINRNEVELVKNCSDTFGLIRQELDKNPDLCSQLK